MGHDRISSHDVGLQPSCGPGAALQAPDGSRHCVGCPGVSRGILAGLLDDSVNACGFDSVVLEARDPVPSSWPRKYGLALVRRGYLIRLRGDPAGHTTAIDAVGPGCAFPIGLGEGVDGEDPELGYAVGRTLVCLCTPPTLEGGLVGGGTTAVDLHRLLIEGIQRMERLADARGRSSAASKVAALLCTLADTLRPGSPTGCELPADFLQRDLAALLSIRHESVCRVLRSFIDQGLVARDAEGMHLLDRARLESL